MENLVNGCVFCLKYSKGLLFVHSTNQKNSINTEEVTRNGSKMNMVEQRIQI